MSKQESQTDGREPTLYDRVGGESAISAVIDRFYAAVIRDELLAPFFAKSDMAALRRMLVEFVSAALDGPSTYTGKPISHAHQGRGIGPKHLQRFVDLMLVEFKGLGLSPEDEYDAISRIDRYADEVTGGFGVDG